MARNRGLERVGEVRVSRRRSMVRVDICLVCSMSPTVTYLPL